MQWLILSDTKLIMHWYDLYSLHAPRKIICTITTKLLFRFFPVVCLLIFEMMMDLHSPKEINLVDLYVTVLGEGVTMI